MLFLVLEVVPGETLAERLDAGPLPVKEALGIGVQVAEALEAAHRGGVVHRDLKPSNVKVTPEGKVKVLDFGLAKALAPETEAPPLDTMAATRSQTATGLGTILGTPGYMSPEQARGQAVDEATDLWALGCVLYEMLTGRPSFRSDSVVDSLAAVLDREPDWSRLPARVSSPTKRLLHQCLEKDPARRLRDARQARRVLEEALAPGGVRRPTWVWVAGLAAAAALVFLARQTRRDTAPAVVPARLTQVTFAEGIEGSPAWSPDGTRLAFAAEAEGVRKIFVKTLLGGEQTRVTGGRHDDIQPAWSPDGSRIVFQNIERTKFDVRVVDLASKGLTWVTNDIFQDVHPSWAPGSSASPPTEVAASTCGGCPCPPGARPRARRSS